MTYVFECGASRYKGYSVMVKERPGLHVGGVWNQTCIFCHNTMPYFDALGARCTGQARPGTRERWSIGCCRPSAAGGSTRSAASRAS